MDQCEYVSEAEPTRLASGLNGGGREETVMSPTFLVGAGIC